MRRIFVRLCWILLEMDICVRIKGSNSLKT
jgi:hypothetical protein